MLLAHPDISDCAVAKVVRDGIEIPRAYVIRRSQLLSPTAIVEYSRTQLVSYKELTGGVVLVTRIPRLPSGKIQRHLLEGMPRELGMKKSWGSWWPAWTVSEFSERLIPILLIL